MVQTAVAEHTPELVILAESSSEANILALSLSQAVVGTYDLVPTPTGISRPLQILSRLPRGRISYVQESTDLTALRVDPVIGRELLICGVHLRSKLHLQSHDQALLTTRLRQEIEGLESKIGHTRTVLIGDFNMNPFEHGVVSSESLHAIPVRRVALRLSRKVSGQERAFFYNPMWNLFGDQDRSPGGTYYRSDSSTVCYFWNIFDQVLVRPGLITRLSVDGVRVLSSIGDKVNLLTPSGFPNAKEFSDHLPLLVSLRSPRRSENVGS